MLCFLAGLGGARFFRAATAVFLGLLALFFGVHAVYHDIFSEYLSVGMLGVAGGALTGYWREALRGIVRCLPEILLMLVPFVLWLVFGKRLAPEGFGAAKAAAARALPGLPAGGSVGRAAVDGRGRAALAQLRRGLCHGHRRCEFRAADGPAHRRRPGPGGRRAPARGPGRAHAPAPEPTPTPLPTPTPAPTPTPEVFTPEPQVLDIDFEALMENEWEQRHPRRPRVRIAVGAELDERVHGHVRRQEPRLDLRRELLDLGAGRDAHADALQALPIPASSLKTSTAPSPPPRRRAASS